MRLVQNPLNNKIQDSFDSTFASEEAIDLLLRRASGSHAPTSSSILGADHGSLYYQSARRGVGTLRPEKPSKTELNYLKELREEASKNRKSSSSRSSKSKAQKRASGSSARSGNSRSKPIMTSRERYLEETLKKDGIPVKQWLLLCLLIGLLWYQVRSSFSVGAEKSSSSSNSSKQKQKQKQRQAKQSGNNNAGVNHKGKVKRVSKKVSTSSKVKKNKNGESATTNANKKHEIVMQQQEKEQVVKDAETEQDVTRAPELSVGVNASSSEEVVPEVVATPAAKRKKKKGKKKAESTAVDTAISSVAAEAEVNEAQEIPPKKVDVVLNEISTDDKNAEEINDFPSEASAPDSTSTDGSSAFESDFDDNEGWTTVGGNKHQEQVSSSQPAKATAVEKVATNQDTTTASEKPQNGVEKEQITEEKEEKPKAAARPAPAEEKLEQHVPSIDDDAALARMLQDKENAAVLRGVNSEADDVWEEVTTKKKKLSKKFQESSEVVVA
uniref:Uncharacterized protein n=1 Tax=Leptocylindrus danicus TaxID=163516 RepID=A0A7S2P2Y0_9STRA|mmetsp:Transcript_21743/g.32484  ORF Transcript_21743/g.32484 Transcript_21743/m.32484 type:complete len:498 (+) Transcript_21743:305-1798(+)|eukprot:CAMPEP_0116009738 /NCGR_PEP_ID=MMETSP0321-20121206/3603_1 /TAXON_ID=163516 /ORGANISM="Leptocylindrus danicus var. danicus, Strain B650" /LENGTH=497 /DNA_ID=CAMNT_0003478741 /DNA_START=301 /DNA_END=1794 /DNA_ORIENTATION=+